MQASRVRAPAQPRLRTTTVCVMLAAHWRRGALGACRRRVRVCGGALRSSLRSAGGAPFRRGSLSAALKINPRMPRNQS